METFNLAMLGPQRTRRVSLLVVGLFVVATTSNGQTPLASCASPIATLGVRHPFRQMVIETWRRSITFRRQVARLASEPTLAVTVGFWAHPGPDLRARTQFTREGQRLTRADVQIKAMDTRTIVEFIAHELEHVLEQLDGVDLARMGGRGGVVVSGRFVRPHAETKRAQQVGRIVAAEYAADQATADGACLEARR